jgi:hypothetical protein
LSFYMGTVVCELLMLCLCPTVIKTKSVTLDFDCLGGKGGLLFSHDAKLGLLCFRRRCFSVRGLLAPCSLGVPLFSPDVFFSPLYFMGASFFIGDLF